MPRFKTTENIFKDFGEFFDPNWMDSNTLILPLKIEWDYKREMQIEDVDIWEILFESTGGIGIYAAWLPYAEFYLIKTGWDNEKIGNGVETYYGAGSQKLVYKKAIEMGIPLSINKIWVNEEKAWLYQ